jgi:hypothetical protein
MNLFPSFGFLPKEGRPSLPSASFGKLHLWRGGGFLKEARRPSASFGVLRRPSASFGVLRRPSASFGKLHLWRGGGFPKEANLFPSFGFLPKEGRPSLPSGSFTSGGFPKEAEGSELVLKKARPSASSRRKDVLRFLREATPLAGWRLSERSALPSESFTSGGGRRGAGKSYMRLPVKDSLQRHP